MDRDTDRGHDCMDGHFHLLHDHAYQSLYTFHDNIYRYYAKCSDGICYAAEHHNHDLDECSAFLYNLPDIITGAFPDSFDEYSDGRYYGYDKYSHDNL